MEQGNSYKLQGVTVREFHGKRFLSTSKDITRILQADDIGSVLMKKMMRMKLLTGTLPQSKMHAFSAALRPAAPVKMP